MSQRNNVLQGVLLLLFVGVLVFVGVQISAGIARNNINVDWSVFQRKATYGNDDVTYLTKLFQSLWFTVRISLLSIVLALLLGIVVGVSRLSGNPVVRGISSFYVELFRNTPLLIQIFFWYFALVNAIPQSARDALGNALGSAFNVPGLGEGVIAGVGALSIYTSSYIAETVRAGIQSVPKGQFEAASSLGLSGLQSLTQIVLPQALRVVIPPLGNQFLNLTKNSSLIHAIGLSDLFFWNVQVQSSEGQGVVAILSITLAYLVLSLSITALLNAINKRLTLPSR